MNYLLYDGSCQPCTDLAGLTKTVGEGWLEIRSLDDADVRRLLDVNRPGWKWRPMLVTQKNGRVRIWSGLGMAFRLLIGLGPRRTFRLMRIAV